MSKRGLFVFVVSLMGMISSAFAGSVGKVVALSGTPKATNSGTSHSLIVGSEIFENDNISVGTGNAQILFIDGTKLVVGSGSSILIDKFVLQNGSNTAKNFTVDALRGTFRFITGKSAKSAYNIQTANATIGIRGTGFDFWVQDKTGVAVLLGKVKLCNKGKNCVDLNPHCELGVSDNSSARKFEDLKKGTFLRNHLPFIVNQSPLRTDFRLNVKDCSSALALSNPFNSGSNQRSPPEPPNDGCNKRSCGN